MYARYWRSIYIGVVDEAYKVTGDSLSAVLDNSIREYHWAVFWGWLASVSIRSQACHFAVMAEPIIVEAPE
ncbi:hypothetical protein CEXT_285781 [Caerostris extrusa]|uniref:Uncharacterized protein n=1 Tax=Caerostris extrusa TaxID=172846 RepID=A0AAV4V0U2_CAEEX|nr:hypothetical protein CEXT_285781 [Caerostris extrusa]